MNESKMIREKDYWKKGKTCATVVEYREPTHANTKGHGKRLRSSKEKAKRKRLCRGCNQRGVSHDRRNCSALLRVHLLKAILQIHQLPIRSANPLYEGCCDLKVRHDYL